MKKYLALILVMLLCISCLVGCDDLFKAVHREKELHEHTFEYIAYESGHFKQYTCGCPSPEIMEMHYDENGNYLCDACKIDLIELVDEWQNDETHHWWVSYNDQVYCYGEHENLDADLNCDICGYRIDVPPAPTNHFLRNQSGAEWLKELTSDDIAEIKIISETVGVAPGTFKNISASSNKDVIERVFENYYWLDTAPIPKENGQIDGGGAVTVKFILNDNTEKQLYFNNGNCLDSKGNYFELLYTPGFEENDDYVSSYAFVTYGSIGTIYDSNDAEVCNIIMEDLEFIRVMDDIVLDGWPITHYIECDFGKLCFISEIYFYIEGITEGDVFKDEFNPVYFQLCGNTLDDLISLYDHEPE